MRKIVVLNGQGGVGKSTIAIIAKTMLNIPVYNFSIVDPIKEAAKILGWQQEKTNSARLFLSELKDSSSKFNDFPFQYLCSRIDNLTHQNYLVFVDIRDGDDISKLYNKYIDKVFTLLVNRDSVNNLDFTNHADLEVYDFLYDFIIDNNQDMKYLRECVNGLLIAIGIPEGEINNG